jgi:hypothetical protein
MTNWVRLMVDLGVGVGLAVVLIANPGASLAEDSALETAGPASIVTPGSDVPQVEHIAYWRARGEAARVRLAAAEAELSEANASVSRMQRDNHPRGEARQRLRAEQANAQSAYADAIKYLETELPSEARSAGAQQAWLRDPSVRTRAGTHGRQ